MPHAGIDADVAPTAQTGMPLRHLDVSVSDGVYGTVGVHTEMRDGVVHASITGGSDVVAAMPELHQFLQRNDVAVHSVSVQHIVQTLGANGGATVSAATLSGATLSSTLSSSANGGGGQNSASMNGGSQQGGLQQNSSQGGSQQGGSQQGSPQQNGGRDDPQRGLISGTGAVRDSNAAAAFLNESSMASTSLSPLQGSTLSIHI